MYIKHKRSSIIKAFRATQKVNIGKLWRAYLFDTTAERTIERESEKHLNLTAFSATNSENEFKETFYKIMHLFKAKATLSDYLDLNRRYIRTTDVILFEDGMVKADIVPKQFFNSVIENLYSYAFTSCDKLFEDCDLNEIADCLIIDEKVIVDGINQELGTSITNMSEAYTVLEENRYQRLQHLIDSKFTDSKLLTLLDLFETRNDKEINDMVTDNADIPTICRIMTQMIMKSLLMG